MRHSIYPVIFANLCVLWFLSGCGSASGTVETGTPAQASLQITPERSATPTPATQRTLTICLGEEPASLYPYGSLSAAARSVQAAIYDGPIDTNSYGYQAVILQKIPSLEDGDAQLQPIPVEAGDAVVDAGGQPVTLAAGVRLRPGGCHAQDCVITYDGVSAIQMDQMVVNFTLLPGLTWSDGEPLTADDSLFSYQIASSPNTPGSRYLFERTLSYEMVDELTLQWWGKPGYVDSNYFTNFWTPYPRHLWGDFSAAELPGVEAAARAPVGWGAYIIQDWMPGEGIYLSRNPHYFRSAEGLPAFDSLVFRFVTDPNVAISQLIAGTCDLLDPSVGLDNQVQLLNAFSENRQLKAIYATSMNLERLDFGIRPAVYDDGFSLDAGDRADLFGDKRTR